MEHNKAPGPDGFPPELSGLLGFIKGRSDGLFLEFHEVNLPLSSLNFGTIILLPKNKDAKVIQQYRPICFVGCLVQNLC